MLPLCSCLTRQNLVHWIDKLEAEHYLQRLPEHMGQVPGDLEVWDCSLELAPLARVRPAQTLQRQAGKRLSDRGLRS